MNKLINKLLDKNPLLVIAIAFFIICDVILITILVIQSNNPVNNRNTESDQNSSNQTWIKTSSLNTTNSVKYNNLYNSYINLTLNSIKNTQFENKNLIIFPQEIRRSLQTFAEFSESSIKKEISDALLLTDNYDQIASESTQINPKIKTINDRDINKYSHISSNIDFKWPEKINEKNIEKRTFFQNSDTQVSAEFLKVTNLTAEYYDNYDVQIVILPWGFSSNQKTAVIMPKINFEEYVKNLSVTSFISAINISKTRQGTLFFPKLSFYSNYSLKPVLMQYGFNFLFYTPLKINMKSDSSYQKYVLSDFTSSSKLTVNDEGLKETKTHITQNNDPNDIFYMEVNKPFIFAVFDSKTQEIILFSLVRKIN